ncbi:MAG: hypothetical protein ACE5EX_09965, partial [Phycisphaerae bacterium]
DATAGPRATGDAPVDEGAAAVAPAAADAATLNPAAMTPADLAHVLSAVGGRPVAVEQIEADLAAGAPTNADGTIHLVRYTAWLLKEIAGAG